MKNLLIITYYFPPERSVGSIRVKGLAKFLPYFGWNVFVLAPFFPQRESKEFNIVETPLSVKEMIGNTIKSTKYGKKEFIYYLSFKVLITSFLRDIFPFPDNKVGWVPIAAYIGKKIVRKYNISAIISSYSPATTHLVAYEIKKTFPHIFWIADFRDLWTQNHYYRHRGLRHIYENFLEKKVISLADVLTTVSENWKDKLKEKFNKPSFAIPTGFDPNEISDNPPLNSKKFNIVYTGSLYFGEKRQNPERFVKIIKNVLEKNLIKRDKLEIIFYGKYKDRNNLFFKSIRENFLEDIFKFPGFLPREEILKIQRTAQVLLLFDWNAPDERGVCPAKIFEYIASKKPILVIGKYDSEVQKIIEKTNAGFFCKTDEEIENTILNLYKEWENNGFVSFEGREDKINNYTHKKMAEKFAEILENK